MVRCPHITLLLLLVAGAHSSAHAATASALSDAQQRMLRAGFAACMARKKGPYTENYCVCPDGSRELIRRVNGKTIPPCGGKFQFCAALRHPCTDALSANGMYIANIFSRDLHTWKEFRDHHDLIRGYVLEKYFMETHPTHTLAVLRGWGGLSGAESEAAALPELIERYLALPTFNDTRHFLLAYELQKRFFLRDNQGQIQRARVLAIQIYARDPAFKHLRDATHNQISAALVPQPCGPGNGDEYVLQTDELENLVRTAQALERRLEPVVDAGGQTRPWDIEFGFAGGKLWLFQVRPFVGNNALRNVPALASLAPPATATAETVALDEMVR